MRRRTLRANAGLVFAGDTASKLGLLLTTLVAARALSVGEFAVVAATLAAAGIMASVLDGGSALLIARDGAASKERRWSLASALARERVPLVLAVLAGSTGVGLVIGRPVEAELAVGLALSSACAQTLAGIARAAQDTRPEAESKLLGAVLTIAALSVLAVAPAAAPLLATMLAASVLALWPLVRGAAAGRGAEVVRPVHSFRRAIPLGLLALATIVYFRSGTIILSVVADPKATASFAVASSAAFGFLMLPNAVSAALMPRLAAFPRLEDQVDLARRALRWTAVLSTLLSCALAALAPEALPLLFGASYRSAVAPVWVLAAAVVVVSLNTVLGTTLLARGRTSVVIAQSVASLAVNLALLVVLGSAFGAVGGAAAMLCCELVGLVWLVRSTVRELPGLLPHLHGALAPGALGRGEQLS